MKNLMLMMVVLALMAGSVGRAMAASDLPLNLALGSGIGINPANGDVEALVLVLSTRASQESVDTINNWQARGDFLKAVKFVGKVVVQNGRLYVMQRGVNGVKASFGIGAQVGVPRLDLGVYGSIREPWLLLKYNLLD